jgi:hypothetical protein
MVMVASGNRESFLLMESSLVRLQIKWKQLLYSRSEYVAVEALFIEKESHHDLIVLVDW